MIVKVSTRGQETELERIIRIVRRNYQRAVEQNTLRPGFIRNPAAWALYKAWREMDVKGNKCV